MPLIPLLILILQLQLTQNVFPLMRFLILEIVKIHMEQDLANKGGVVTLTFDFWPQTI